QDIEARYVEPGPGRTDLQAGYSVLSIQEFVVGGELGIEAASPVDVHGLDISPVLEEGVGEAEPGVQDGVGLEDLAAAIYEGMIYPQASFSGQDAGNERKFVVDVNSGGKSTLSGQVRIDSLRGEIALAGKRIGSAGVALGPVLEHLIHAETYHLALQRRPVEAGPQLIAVFVLSRILVDRVVHVILAIIPVG